MTFVRARLENYHLFLGVDLVIFCEGGQQTIDAEEAVYQMAQEAIDSIYWTKRIAHEHPSANSLCCRPLGSKSAVLKAFESAKHRRTKSILFCIDSDHEQAFHRHYTDPRLLHTYGYSIENDIIDTDSIARLVCHIRPTAEQTHALCISTKVYQSLCRQTSKLWRFILADLCLHLINKKGILNSGLIRYISSASPNNPPELEYELIRRSVLESLSVPNRPKFRFTEAPNIEPMRSLSGHSLFDLFFVLFTWQFRHEFGQTSPGTKKQILSWLCSCWSPNSPVNA